MTGLVCQCFFVKLYVAGACSCLCLYSQALKAYNSKRTGDFGSEQAKQRLHEMKQTYVLESQVDVVASMVRIVQHDNSNNTFGVVHVQVTMMHFHEQQNVKFAVHIPLLRTLQIAAVSFT